jgi:hypothetical protein
VVERDHVSHWQLWPLFDRRHIDEEFGVKQSRILTG